MRRDSLLMLPPPEDGDIKRFKDLAGEDAGADRAAMARRRAAFWIMVTTAKATATAILLRQGVPQHL
ncbi:MAG: hypothetical protein HY901_19675, partial [Deltaproteobacteria bacterium]|nr:hypothetical protein [Deltaproteobacteria bacterium]